MGLSRSAATVLAYAMKEFGWSLERALSYVRRCRPGVQPNPGFMRQLDFYQGILNASRHSSFWEPQAGERVEPEPERAVPWDDGGPRPSPPASSPPAEEDGGPGPLGAARRPRISLCAVMRSISQMEAPEPPEEPLGGQVSARGRGDSGGTEGTQRLRRGPLFPQASEGSRGPGDAAGPEAEPPEPRSGSRPRRVVRQDSVDGDRDPEEERSPAESPASPSERGPPAAP
ncbi:UNVERIFIED_CONTAM: hypothetical protein H355_004777 [Colinus virginianus]|nr:hypothetical protein H355_004777 [Colinus virginianus]